MDIDNVIERLLDCEKEIISFGKTNFRDFAEYDNDHYLLSESQDMSTDLLCIVDKLDSWKQILQEIEEAKYSI